MTDSDTYAHILMTASALIAKQGFAETSMNDIVRASGLSKGGVYWHFKSKDDIIQAIVNHIFEQQMMFLKKTLSAEGSAIDRIKHLLQLVATSVNDAETAVPSSIDIYALVLRNDNLLHNLRTYFEQYQQLLTQLITQGIEEGELATDNPKQIAMVFISTIEGILLLHDVMGEKAQTSTLITQATDLLLNGLLIKDDK
ncbi:MAG: TetR/AcrR family transcriptional regulator [Chloroflexota bacterium]